MRRIGRYALAALVWSLAAPVPARADDMTVDLEGFRQRPAWQPPGVGIGNVPRVDLTDRIPEPGHQQRTNSCLGWTVGYALKSYQESLDHGWAPDHPSRIFSPYFVWRFVNGGQNVGGSYERVFERLKEDGCCTWQSMPFREEPALDPSDAARTEARGFRIQGFQPVRDAASIKRALQAGSPVPIAVSTDPVFMSGKFDVYDWNRRREGVASGRGQGWTRDGSWHAVLVVGYDDTRGAFRVLNSWGKEWADGGYCWIAQDLFAQVPNVGSTDEEFFVGTAWIVEDVKTGGRPPPTGDHPVAASGRTQYAGLTEQGATWLVQVFLVGEAAALDRVSSVQWYLPDGAGGWRAYAAATGREGQFSLLFRYAGVGHLDAVARVTFSDGSTKDVPTGFDFAPPERGDLRMVQQDRYAGVRSGYDYWEWSVRLEGNELDLADVASVTYHLGPTFPIPEAVVTESPQTGFVMTTSGHTPFALSATILFKDGTTADRSISLAFRDPVRRQLSIQGSTLYAGNWEGTDVWNWTVWIDGPLDVLRQVARVVYHLPEDYQPPTWTAGHDPLRGFPMSSSASTSFPLAAEVFFPDGTSQRLDATMRIGN